jgi:uncharacterized membrane protein
MTWYELWLFLHISGVSIWLGGAVVAQVLGALAKRSGDPARTVAFGQDMALVGPWVLMPSALLVLVSGVLLVEEGHWDWGETFVVLGLLGWAVVSFTAFGYITRSMGRIGVRMAAEGPSLELGAQVNRLVLVARVLIVVLFAVVFVMVVKPGT